MKDLIDGILASPPYFLLVLGLLVLLVALIGRSPVGWLRFTLRPAARAAVAGLGLALGGLGVCLLLPTPVHFAIGGTVTAKANNTPVRDAIVEAHDDATSSKPTNQAQTDDHGVFFLNYGKDDVGRYIRLRVVKDRYQPATGYALIRPGAATVPFTLEPARTGGPQVAVITHPNITAGIAINDDTSPSSAPAPGPDAALDFSALNSGQLVIWRAAQPRYEDPSIGPAFAKDFPAGKLLTHDIPRETFITAVEQPPANIPAPDMAFVDNYSNLKPLLEAKSVWVVWGQPRFNTNGWWVIFKSTQHLVQAQAFARWLNRAPGWQPRARSVSISNGAIQVVSAQANAALRAMLAHDQAALNALLDPDAAHTPASLLSATATLEDAQPILIFGTPRLAFVLLAVVASGDDLYGMRHMIFILRAQGAGWRILAIQPNARMPNTEGAQGIEANPALLHAFDVHLGTAPPPASLPAATLVAPADGAELPRFPTRPDIAWQSAAPTTVSTIVEFQFGQRGNAQAWSDSALTFLDPPHGPQPFHVPAPFGVGAQPHRWRIWTLDPSGIVAISPWRTLIYTN